MPFENLCSRSLRARSRVWRVGRLWRVGGAARRFVSGKRSEGHFMNGTDRVTLAAAALKICGRQVIPPPPFMNSCLAFHRHQDLPNGLERRRRRNLRSGARALKYGKSSRPRSSVKARSTPHNLIRSAMCLTIPLRRRRLIGTKWQPCDLRRRSIYVPCREALIRNSESTLNEAGNEERGDERKPITHDRDLLHVCSIVV